ncbi:hypothetical protein Gotur_010918, partial [Gossypium turneri]
KSSVLLPFWFSRFHLLCFTLPTRKPHPPSPSQHQTEPPLTFSFIFLLLLFKLQENRRGLIVFEQELGLFKRFENTRRPQIYSFLLPASSD